MEGGNSTLLIRDYTWHRDNILVQSGRDAYWVSWVKRGLGLTALGLAGGGIGKQEEEGGMGQNISSYPVLWIKIHCIFIRILKFAPI